MSIRPSLFRKLEMLNIGMQSFERSSWHSYPVREGKVHVISGPNMHWQKVDFETESVLIDSIEGFHN